MDKPTELMISVIIHFTIRRRPYLSSRPSQYSNGIMDWKLYLQILLVPGICSTQSIWWPFGDLFTFYSLLLTCSSPLTFASRSPLQTSDFGRRICLSTSCPWAPVGHPRWPHHMLSASALNFDLLVFLIFHGKKMHDGEPHCCCFVVGGRSEGQWY